MRLYPPWAVLASGSPTWVEQRARTALSIDYEEEELGVSIPSPFKLVPGTGHYHLLFSMDATSVGDEMRIAKALSRECAEPVYAIMEGDEFEWVQVYRSGTAKTLDVEPGQLAQSLGCPFPEDPHVPQEPLLQRVALVEGVHSSEALHELEEEAEHPLPPDLYRLEDTSAGLLIRGGTRPLGFAAITLAERLPHATVYSVTASPSLDVFIVSIMRREECIGQFARPPRNSGLYPVIGEVKGERTPETILAALGIAAEWFRFPAHGTTGGDAP